MFYKAVSPGAIGHENTAFIEAAPIVASCGFQGYWFDPNLDFTCNPDEVRALLEEYDLRAAGCNLPVEFRKTEETWRADMDRLQDAVTFARQIGITRMMTWIVPFSNELILNPF